MPNKPKTHKQIMEEKGIKKLPSMREKRKQIDRVEVDKQYDLTRGSSTQRGYGSRWRKLRKMILSRQPLCQPCLERGTKTPSVDVDHIIPKHAGGTDHVDNLQGICRSCHNKKTRRGL